MQSLKELKQSIVERLDLMPEPELREVLNFVDFMLVRSQTSDTLEGENGVIGVLPAPDAFLACAGTWEFEPGELEEIMRDIEQSRLMELEEEDVILD
jgi:hypothetical protein